MHFLLIFEGTVHPPCPRRGKTEVKTPDFIEKEKKKSRSFKLHTLQRFVELVPNLHLQQPAPDFYYMGHVNRTKADNMARWYQVHLNRYQLAYY